MFFVPHPKCHLCLQAKNFAFKNVWQSKSIFSFGLFLQVLSEISYHCNLEMTAAKVLNYGTFPVNYWNSCSPGGINSTFSVYLG